MIRGVPFGRRFDDATFETFEVTPYNKQAYDACLRLVDGESNGVFLEGAEGVGKSHLLRAVAVAYHRDPIWKERPSEPLTSSEAEMVRRLETAAEGKSVTEMLQSPEMRQAIEELEMSGRLASEAPQLDVIQDTPGRTVEYWPMLDLVSALRAEVTHGEREISQRCCTCDLLVLDDVGREKMSEFILQEIQRIVDWRYREILPMAVATNRTTAQLIAKYEAHTYSRLVGLCEIVNIGGVDRRTSPAR